MADCVVQDYIVKRREGQRVDVTFLKVELSGVTWVRGPRGDVAKGAMEKRASQQMCGSDPEAEQRDTNRRPT